MRLGVVIGCPMSTGAWHFCGTLLKHLKLVNKNIVICLFKPSVDTIFDTLDYKLFFDTLNIKIASFPNNQNFKTCSFRNLPKKIVYSIYNKKISSEHQSELTEFYDLVNSMDVLYYFWPYNSKPLDAKKPSFFTPHDFIYSHWFGLSCGDFYNRNDFFEKRATHLKFLNSAIPIVTSKFSANELLRIFPEYHNKIHVIYLSNFNEFSKANKSEINYYLHANGIFSKYILWPSNHMYHKNLSQLLGAFYIIKNKYPDIKLVLTGYGTDNIKKKCDSMFYSNHIYKNTFGADVIGLGLLPPNEFRAVFQSASIVINSSLDEGTPGSIMDAWKAGIPAAMSDIPVFVEYANFYKIKSLFFNPKNSYDIANKIITILDDYKKYKKRAIISSKNITSYNWLKIASQFNCVFENAIKRTQS